LPVSREARPPVREEAPVAPGDPVQVERTDPPAGAGDDESLAARGIEVLEPEGATKAEKIARLAAMAETCEACRSLGTLREVMVFSVGNPDAPVMFVGEAPGAEEERQREPFVGPAGQLLTRIIKAMDLRRPEDVYISNIVKFRPKIGDGRMQGSRNRTPDSTEMKAAVKYVMAEIDVVRPRVIVALGGTAAEGLLDLTESIGKLRGRFFELKGIPVLVTYHPSYLVRLEEKPDRGISQKRLVWEDMLMAMEKAGLPISEKQRGYFR
jgi:DNA polymerase